MVVGANGTGKSTVLNAICLGLGGEPKLLGRADDARSFIKHGEDLATIEIELQNPDNDDGPNDSTTVFGRAIDRNKGTERGRGRGASSFFINGEQVSREQLVEKVQKEFHITLGNLCTFLPQDKVGSFSGLTQQELLMETEKTLTSSQHLYETHMSLIEAEAELNDARNGGGSAGEVELLEKKLEAITRDLTSLERAKEKLEERERALQQMELLKQKRIWTEVDLIKAKAVELKEERKQHRERIKEVQASLEPFKEKEETLTRERQNLENAEKKSSHEQSVQMKEIEKQEKKFAAHDDEIETTFSDVADLDNRRQDLKLRLQTEVENVQKYKDLMEKANLDPQDLDEKVMESKNAFSEARKAAQQAARHLRELEQQLQDLENNAQHLQSKLAKQENAKLQQERAVYAQFPQLKQITELVHQHASEFRKPVHGPVACLIAPKPGTEKHHAAFLEQHVSNGIWKGFVVETKQDQDLLYRLVRQERNIPINIFMVDRVDAEIKRPYGRHLMESFKRNYGIAGFLDELFTAPAPILQCLRTQSGIHSVLSGSNKTQDCIDSQGLLTTLSNRDPEISTASGLQSCTVCCSNSSNQLFKYTSRISEYSGKPSTRIDQVKQASFLQSDNAESNQIALELKQELDKVHDQLQPLRPQLATARTEKDSFEGNVQELNQQYRAWVDQKSNFSKLVAKHNQAQQKRDKCQQELDKLSHTIVEEKAQLAQKLKQRSSASVAVTYALDKASRLFLRHTREHAIVQLQKTKTIVEERKVRAQLEEMNQTFEQVKNDAIRVNDEYNRKRAELKETREKALHVAPLEDENGNPTPLRERLEAMENLDTLEDLDAAIEECEQQANEIHANPQVIQQYLKKVEEQKELQEKLDDARESRAIKERDMEQKREPWQAQLQTNINKINALFETYMAEMGCTGEVRLKQGEPDAQGRPANFQDWGIEIMVSFREGTKAQVLSAKVQSGGERSVSTIMYLMALQDMMVAPFRCVDEINQGLDDRNERLVFKRIVENSTKAPKPGDLRSHTGQYFLITPKLLPNLYDMEEEAVTVLFVFNGTDIGSFERVFLSEISVFHCPLVFFLFSFVRFNPCFSTPPFSLFMSAGQYNFESPTEWLKMDHVESGMSMDPREEEDRGNEQNRRRKKRQS